ncbi:MAG: DUF2804 domain-containing protein [Treponema sp.]|nr:DUF2804 domain-containing protein [Treponema sp.]
MYTREIQAPRACPIENGMPLAGTWNSAFDHVDLLEIARPYRLPLPRWLRDCRIKEWESFSVQDEHFFLEASLANFKLFQLAQVFLHDRESGENHIFRKLMPGGSWRLPRNLRNASVECRSSRFFFRIHTWLIADTVKLDLDIAAAGRQPAFTAHLSFGMNGGDTAPAAASLNFTGRRNMYAFKALTAVRGDVVLGGKHAGLDPARCTGMFRDYKGFFPYRMKRVSCGGMGFDAGGRRYGFHIAENQAKDSRKNNENVLWAGKNFTPLPPVRITMPDGPESDWIIQDLDGMVDLVFTPKEINRFGANFLAVKGDFFAPMGYYNGVLVSGGNEQIQVRNQWGTGEKLYLRV